MRAIILVAGAALALSACGGGNSQANEVDTISANNLVVDANMMTPGDMANMDANMAMDPNMSMDANTANLIQQDLNSNTPDANLANGI